MSRFVRRAWRVSLMDVDLHVEFASLDPVHARPSAERHMSGRTRRSCDTLLLLDKILLVMPVRRIIQAEPQHHDLREGTEQCPFE